MKRLLRLLWYYFSWQRIMAYITAIGAAMILAGLLYDGIYLTPFLVGAGTLLAVAVPTMLACFAFRQIVGNRHLAMLPRLRSFAVGALVMLALVASLMSLAFLYILPEAAPIERPVVVLVLNFSAISVYLLVSQWLVTFPIGTVALAFIPVLVLRLGSVNHPIVASHLDEPWLLFGLVLLGWAWLLAAMQKAPVLGVSSAAWCGGALGFENTWGNQYWMPQIGASATAAGTLLRSARDGWPNRIVTQLASALGVPVFCLALLYVMGVPFRQGSFDSAFFLFLSLFGICMSASMAFAEWPARLRYLWLRIRGDRCGFWRLLERTLLEETLLVASITTLVALLAFSLTEVPGELLLLYVLGCIVVSLLGSYLGCWIRISGWGHLPQALVLIIVMLICFAVVAYLRDSGDPTILFLLPPALGGLALGFRQLARRGFAKVDWCAVRPLRRARQVSIKKTSRLSV